MYRRDEMRRERGLSMSECTGRTLAHREHTLKGAECRVPERLLEEHGAPMATSVHSYHLTVHLSIRVSSAVRKASAGTNTALATKA